jgi:putative membrane protein insertion efficiency factor
MIHHEINQWVDLSTETPGTSIFANLCVGIGAKRAKIVFMRMQRILLVAIEFYRGIVSPYLKPRCKFHPSCSEYAAEAIRKYGPLRGTIKSVIRLLKCNPLSKGGVDVP